MCVVLGVLREFTLTAITTTAPWAKLPVSVTMWCYLFGSISMGLASIYYCKQPEEFKLPVEVRFV